MLYPVLLKILLNWLKQDKPDMTEGALYAFIMCSSVFLRSYFEVLSYYLVRIMDARMRNIIRVTLPA